MNAAAAWAHPQLAAQVLRPRQDGCSEVALRVEGLQTARQILQLEQLIRALPGVRRVAIDAPAQRVRIVWDVARTPLPQLLNIFASAGCAAQPLRHDSIEDARAFESHAALKRLLVAGMCAMQVMTYAFVMYIGAVDFVDFTTRGLFRWLSFLTTIPVVFYSAKPFFSGALQEAHERRLGLNLPVALAVGVVFFAGGVSTLQGHGEIYFDSINMFVFLLLGARYLELRARHRSGALGDAVIDATPLLAERRRSDGQLETVAALSLLAGDHVHIAEGATVPADGILQSTRVEVDEALLSGESRPVLRVLGERLLAGSVLLSGPAEMQVEHSGDATAAAKLGELATRARRARTPSMLASDRAVSRFVTRVLLLTALTAVGWLIVDPARAFEAAVAVLVVACPCAFALTLPATLTRALSVLARRGVLITNAAALEVLARVDYALFDKTGTLTTPQLSLTEVEPLRGDSREQVLQWAAALAHESSHPLAQALATAAKLQGTTLRAHSVQVHASAGISGELDGQKLWLGHAAFALAASGQPASAATAGALILADTAGAIGSFHLDEHVRSDAASTLVALRADGVHCALASGDVEARVVTAATYLQISDWHAKQSPADKLALLQAARDAGHVTLAVGDGTNDVPILAGADVSVALDSGSDLAQAHADLLLLNSRLDGLVGARMIARQVQQIINQSRQWALGYNLCAIPFAALGLVPPWLAAIGMSISSLGVVLNAQRVGRLDVDISSDTHSNANAATGLPA